MLEAAVSHPLPAGSSPAGSQNARARKARVLDELCVPFFFFDLAGTVIYANTRAHRDLRYEDGDLIGKEISQLDGSLSQELWHQIREAICQERTLNYESHLVARDGRVLLGEFQFQYYENGGGAFIVALVTDVSQRKEVEASIIAARESAMEYASQLAEKTRIAEDALRSVSALKLKQDGDYYLTSLLLQPFQQNKAERGEVEIDWLVKQKTGFSYRKWNSEIGGDFCSSDKVVLKGRNYNMFVIADAMGKANQGASGALILATIINTYVERTRKTAQLSNSAPERWLRLLYEELRAGFAGFQGAMMIGAVIGLADIQTRFIYFFNAEQPRAVSYYNGRAGYVGRAESLRKIGMPGTAEEIVIELYALRPGESLIFGSDGRDDVRLNGGDEVNHDDHFFLSLVEAAGGILENIYELTGRTGTIIDDYSLLSITSPVKARRRPSAVVRELLAYYRHTRDAAALDRVLATEPANAEALALAANYYLKCGRISEGVICLERYLNVRPLELRAIHSLVWLYCVQKNFEAAADIAERITYREVPATGRKNRNKILTLLATIYRKTGNPRETTIRDRIDPLV